MWNWRKEIICNNFRFYCDQLEFIGKKVSMYKYNINIFIFMQGVTTEWYRERGGGLGGVHGGVEP